MRTIPALLLLAVLSACGQTGPLQMPPAPGEAPPPPPPVEPQVEPGEAVGNTEQ